MYQSGSIKLVKNLNKRHILNLVRLRRGVIARTISNETGLQMSTVLYTLKALSEEGLIINAGLGNTTYQGGKPPATWELNPEFGYIIGVELSSKEARIVVTNFNGDIVGKSIKQIEFTTSHIALAHQLIQIITKFIIEVKLNKKKVLGIGIGIPGSIDSDKGVINFSYSFDFHSVRFVALLEKQLPYNIIIENDANAGALGVKLMHKELRDYRHLLYLSINQKFSGIGIGFIINNHLYRGASNSAGEFNSFLPENKLSGILNNALKKDSKNAIIKKFVAGSEEYNLKDLVENANLGNEASRYVLREIGKEISKIT